MSSSADQARAELRAAVRALRSPMTLLRAAPPTSSPFVRTLAAAGYPPTSRAGEGAVAARAHPAETATLDPDVELALFLLPVSMAARDSLLRTAGTAAAAGTAVVVLGAGVSRHVAVRPGRPNGVPLRPEDPLAAEVAIVACGPAGRIAFVARRHPAPEPPATGHPATDPPDWEWLVTRDAVAAGRAASCLLERTPHLRLRLPALL